MSCPPGCCSLQECTTAWRRTPGARVPSPAPSPPLPAACKHVRPPDDLPMPPCLLPRCRSTTQRTCSAPRARTRRARTPAPSAAAACGERARGRLVLGRRGGPRVAQSPPPCMRAWGCCRPLFARLAARAELPSAPPAVAAPQRRLLPGHGGGPGPEHPAVRALQHAAAARAPSALAAPPAQQRDVRGSCAGQELPPRWPPPPPRQPATAADQPRSAGTPGVLALQPSTAPLRRPSLLLQRQQDRPNPHPRLARLRAERQRASRAGSVGAGCLAVLTRLLLLAVGGVKSTTPCSACPKARGAAPPGWPNPAAPGLNDP